MKIEKKNRIEHKPLMHVNENKYDSLLDNVALWSSNSGVRYSGERCGYRVFQN